MVYCELKKHEDNILIYAIGGYYDDLTGILTVDYINQTYDLVKKPEDSKVYDYYIKRVLQKAQKDFDRKIFKKHIAIEI